MTKTSYIDLCHILLATYPIVLHTRFTDPIELTRSLIAGAACCTSTEYSFIVSSIEFWLDCTFDMKSVFTIAIIAIFAISCHGFIFWTINHPTKYHIPHIYLICVPTPAFLTILVHTGAFNSVSIFSNIFVMNYMIILLKFNVIQLSWLCALNIIYNILNIFDLKIFNIFLTVWLSPDSLFMFFGYCL